MENIEQKLRQIAEKSDISPYFIIGEFVNQYEKMIKPALKEGNIVGARSVIGLATMKLPIVESCRIPINADVFTSYKIALLYLGGLLKQDVKPKLMDDLLNNVERYIKEVELRLRSNKDYQEGRGNLG